MSKPITIITVVEGGNLQQLYCPDPSVTIHHIAIDYDLKQCGQEGLEDLVNGLSLAYNAELPYTNTPSVTDELDEYGMQLEAMRNAGGAS